jgi:hypothetical protein
MESEELTFASDPQRSWNLLPIFVLLTPQEPTSSAFVLEALRIVLSLLHIRRILEPSLQFLLESGGI